VIAIIGGPVILIAVVSLGHGILCPAPGGVDKGDRLARNVTSKAAKERLAARASLMRIRAVATE
jgi:hypothetical protein